MSNALQTVLQTNHEVGVSTVKALKNLRSDFLKIVSGLCVENFPDVKDGSTTADLYTTVALMNGTVDSFGTLEEAAEKKKFFAYDRLDLAVGPFKVGWASRVNSP